LIDTAGWAAAADTIEEQAQRLGADQSRGADVILWCAEAGRDFLEVDAIRIAASGAVVLRVRTKCDGLHSTSKNACATDELATSAVAPGGVDGLRAVLAETVASLTRPPLAPSQSRCRHHIDACIRDLQQAHRHILFDDPVELAALALRGALDQLGEMVGAIYTNDLLDRIFSRFCIGK